MKLAIAFLLTLLACSDSKESSPSPAKAPPKNPMMFMAKMGSPAGKQKIATITVENKASERIQWVKTSIPLESGKFKSQKDLNELSLGHGEVAAFPIKWNFKNGKQDSIAIAGLEFPVYFNGASTGTYTVNRDPKPRTIPFEYGPNLKALMGMTSLNDSLVLIAKIKGDPKLYSASMLANPRVIRNTAQCQNISSRSQFISNDMLRSTHALSATFYFEFCNRQDFGSLIIEVGNNTFENPHSGGLEVEFVKLFAKTPFFAEIRNASDYGASSPTPDLYGLVRIDLMSQDTIADGSARAFRGLWGVIIEKDSLTHRSFRASLAHPLFGVADTASWVTSKSGGIVGTVMPPRASIPDLKASISNLCTDSYNVRVNASSTHQYLNKAPGITGDQPNFSANMPLMQHQVILTGSHCPIVHLMHGVQSEVNRPSYFFTQDRRMVWHDTPRTCFWWSGRPHWHAGQNVNHCNEWHTRSTSQGFAIGETHGWTGEDDQHFGNPHLRAFYELTGDAWAKDLIEYRQTLTLWNKLGEHDWQLNRIGSERSVRLMEDALQNLLLLPNAITAADLASQLDRRLKLRRDGACFAGGRYCSQGVKQAKATWGAAHLESVHDDPRHSQCMGQTPGGTCKQGQPCPDNRCGITWWSGMHLGWVTAMHRAGFDQNMAQELAEIYFDDADFFFQPNGMNAGKRRFNDWSTPVSPFTQSWHAGWITTIETLSSGHPKEAFLNIIKQSLKTSFQCNSPGCKWSTNDKWYQ